MRVLPVEADHRLDPAVRGQVADIGHSVDRVTRPAKARDHVHAAAYALILLDLKLPDESGLDLLKTPRATGDGTNVIAHWTTTADGTGLGLAIVDAAARGAGTSLVFRTPAPGRTNDQEAESRLPAP